MPTDRDLSRAAANIAYVKQKALGEEHEASPDRKSLMKMGASIWQATYAMTDDDAEAAAYLHAFYSLADETGILAETLSLPYEQLISMFCGRWADCAFPVVEMGHKYAAALMATTVSPDLAPDLMPPWKAFLIAVPDGLVEVRNEEQGKTESIRQVLVQVYDYPGGEQKWGWVAMSPGTTCLWSHGMNAAQFLAPSVATDLWEGCLFSAPFEKQDERASAMIQRLVANVCFSMQSKTEYRPIGKAAKSRGEGRRRAGEPEELRVFQLGRPIEIDCREEIRGYILHGEGRRGGPSVRTFVRGHMRRRPGGVARGEAKTERIDPYWRGPDGAPVLVRPSALRDQE